jgi:SAM-dependent methyltransferase
MAPARAPDYRRWFDRWDRQQTTYVPAREARFAAMFDLLEAGLPRRFTVVDLGCGPGSLSRRLLERFPRARSIAVDIDPVLLHLGRHAVGTMGGRLRWVEADLREPSWLDRLPPGRVDAVVSTTALHWLPEPRVRQLYREIHELLPRGGLFLDGDHVPSEDVGPELARLFDGVAERRRAERRRVPAWSRWEGWWRALEREPSLREFFRERRRRFPSRHPRETHLTLEARRRALARAGFRTSGSAYQSFEDRVVVAIR